MSAYTRVNLADDLAAHLKVPVTQSKQTVDFILERLSVVMTENQKIEFRGFGTFVAQTRKEKIGRNPRNPDAGTFVIPARKVVRFKVGKELDVKLNPAKPA
jgi:nucleoid DNA-binding protein